MLRVELSDFNIAFGGRAIFDHVSAALVWNPANDSSRVIGLVGPSGAGKTTLARHILAARYEDERVGLKITPPAAVIGYLPQTAVMFPQLSIYRNARLFEGVGRYRSRFDSKLFEQLAHVLQLDNLLTSKTNVEKLSGGEAQRLMLLRTLSVRPDLLLLDEPATGLDATVRDAFLIDLQDTLRELNISALYISHHWAEVAFLAGRVAYTQSDPRGTSRGPIRALPILGTEEFRQHPPTIDAFRTVYGPGCSSWPLRETTGTPQRVVACFPAVIGGVVGFRRLPPDFRLSEAIVALLKNAPARAALYGDGRFIEWAQVDRHKLVGDIS